jgi:hypothetical protein
MADSSPAASSWERLFLFLENGITLAVMGVIGSLAGVFIDGRYFLFLAVPLGFALHRSRALAGMRAIEQLAGHLLVALVGGSILWWIGSGVNRSREHIPSAQEIAEYLSRALSNKDKGPVNPQAPPAQEATANHGPAPSANGHHQAPPHRSKVETPAAPPPVVIAPSYGNLRQRATDLSGGLRGLLKRHPATHDPNEVLRTAHQVSDEYIQSYDHEVRQVIADFAKHDIRDPGLDKIMGSVSGMMNERMRTYTPIVLNSADVSEIARDLMTLVSKSYESN